MDSDADVLVIGGGIAGAAAALAASRAGARVTVVRRGPGATALAAGHWDSAPPAAVRTALAAAGLPLEDVAGALPHPDGELVAAAVAAPAQARAALPRGMPVAERIVVCGITGLPVFRPAALASLWSDAAALLDGSLEPAWLTLPETPVAGWSPVSLAASIERQPDVIGGAIAHAAREHGAARAIVPAVLGLTRHAATLAAVERAAGVRVGEALGAAPSAPGWRLDRTLLNLLADAGIPVIAGRIVQRSAHGRRVLSVDVETRSGTTTLRARSYVLATGKFIGGGIAAESSYAERALGCDVAIERFARTITDPGAALVLTDPARAEPQPLLAIGVRTDDDSLPLNAAGDVTYDNVFVAGSVRYGIETRAGLGTSAHDGWSAGARAAARAA